MTRIELINAMQEYIEKLKREKRTLDTLYMTGDSKVRPFSCKCSKEIKSLQIAVHELNRQD